MHVLSNIYGTIRFKHIYKTFKDTALQTILDSALKTDVNPNCIYVGQPLFRVTVINGKASWHNDCSKSALI